MFSMCFAQSNGNFFICYGCPYETAYKCEERCQTKKLNDEFCIDRTKSPIRSKGQFSPDI